MSPIPAAAPLTDEEKLRRSRAAAAWALLDHAIGIASEAHLNQTDRAGEPYLYHVLRVGISLLPNVEAAVVGVLHDVLEDGPPLSHRTLTTAMPARIVEAVRVLTRGEEEPYQAYIERICAHPLATQVKLADLNDNLRTERLERINDLPAGDQDELLDRLRNRYLAALWTLERARIRQAIEEKETA